jgi:hypothetical protein
MALIRGMEGLCPCPICLVPADKQLDLSVDHHLRTAEETKGILQQAGAMQSAVEKEEILKTYGLRSIEVCLFVLQRKLSDLVFRMYFGVLKIQILTWHLAGIACMHTIVACLENICGRRSKNQSRQWGEGKSNRLTTSMVVSYSVIMH